MNLSAFWSLLKSAAFEWRANKAQRLSAALSYYAIFSLVPLLIVMIRIVGSVFGEETAQRTIVAQLQQLYGESSARNIELLISNVQLVNSDPFTTAIGLLALLMGATGMFNHLKDSLNTIWGVAPPPARGAVKGYLLTRLLALIMVLTMSVVTLLAIFGTLMLSRIGPQVATLLPGVPAVALLRVVQVVFTFLFVMVVVAATYKVLPDATIAWRDVWVGAFITAAIFVANQGLLSLYLRILHLGSTATIIGAAVVLLVWVYSSSMSFFYGAECTWLYANRHGSRILPVAGGHALPLEGYAAQGLLREEELAALARAREVGASGGELPGRVE